MPKLSLLLERRIWILSERRLLKKGHDAILQEYDAQRNLRMEYLRDHGFWSDLPFNRIKDDFEGYYPRAFNQGSGEDVQFAAAPAPADGAVPLAHVAAPALTTPALSHTSLAVT